MSARINKGRLAAAALFLVIAVIGVVAIVSDSSDEALADTPAEASVVCDRRAVVADHLREKGFQDGEWLWEEQFDLSLPAVSDAGSGSFSDQYITNRQLLVEALNGDKPGQATFRQYELSRVPEHEHQTLLLNGEGFVGVQFTVPTVWAGNTMFTGSELKPTGKTRHSGVGDIAWFYVGSDCQVVESATVRGPCANPQFTSPEPAPPPGQPTPPPVTEVPPTTVPPTTTSQPPESSTTTTVPETTTTVPQCGNKSHWDPEKGQCVPDLNGGTTVPPPPTTARPSSPTTSQAPPAPPSTAEPDPTPPGTRVVNPAPPSNTYTPPGATVGTTTPPTTVSPPATHPGAEPGNGGSIETPSR